MTEFRKKLLYVQGSIKLILDCIDDLPDVFLPNSESNLLINQIISSCNSLKTEIINANFEVKNG